jgi:hypothetical protein
MARQPAVPFTSGSINQPTIANFQQILMPVGPAAYPVVTELLPMLRIVTV